MRGAILNPIKFYKEADLPDYITKFPNMDNVTFGDGYIFGIGSSPEFIRIHLGVMYLQIIKSVDDDLNLDVYKRNDSTGAFEFTETIIGTNITPVGWVGNYIYEFELDLDNGMYYVSFRNGYRSDYFINTDDENVSEDLVYIKYLNSENGFGCIFGGSYFEIYLRGQLTAGIPQNEISSYTSDDGEPVKLRSTPQRVTTLTIKGLHYTYLDCLNTIFACDTVTVNGISYENVEGVSWEPINGGDLGDVTVKLIQKGNDYYYVNE